MPLLRTPAKQLRNATIQVRVEEDVNFKLRKYAEFIDGSPAYVVAEALKLLFNKDDEFLAWLTQHSDKPSSLLQEKAHGAKRPGGHEPDKLF
ncbi:MAG: hypothetical protein LAN61_04810 [Acidobacteriia bacterium]|nr:hypothetical protein [Terriglobia bacterium]